MFEGSNAGLILAEVEFANEASARRFVPPTWMGEEVTMNRAYRNAVLAAE